MQDPINPMSQRSPSCRSYRGDSVDGPDLHLLHPAALESRAPLQVLAAAGQVECEALQWTKCQKFALIVFGFIGTLYSNVTSLKVCSHLGNTARSLVNTVYVQALASLHRLRALLARKLSTDM